MNLEEIKPKEGLGDLLLGMKQTEVIKLIGEPDEKESIKDEPGFDTTIFMYHDLGLTLFFDTKTDPTLNSIETDSDEIELWGEKIFQMNENELKQLFSSKGFTLPEIEEHEWGEKRVSYEDAILDFYFENDHMTSICIGAPVYDNPNYSFSLN